MFFLNNEPLTLDILYTVDLYSDFCPQQDPSWSAISSARARTWVRWSWMRTALLTLMPPLWKGWTLGMSPCWLTVLNYRRLRTQKGKRQMVYSYGSTLVQKLNATFVHHSHVQSQLIMFTNCHFKEVTKETVKKLIGSSI